MIIKSILVSSLLFVVSILGFMFFVPNSVNAAVPDGCKNSFLGLPVWFEYLDMNEECEITGPTYTRTESADQEGRINWTRASGYIAIAVVEILLRIAALVPSGSP